VFLHVDVLIAQATGKGESDEKRRAGETTRQKNNRKQVCAVLSGSSFHFILLKSLVFISGVPFTCFLLCLVSLCLSRVSDSPSENVFHCVQETRSGDIYGKTQSRLPGCVARIGGMCG
jgi:hypothetical protein